MKIITEKENKYFSWKTVLLLIILAFLFCIGLRYSWIIKNHNVDSYKWNGELVIRTNDAFYWGSLSQKAIYGLHKENPLITRKPLGKALPFITLLLVKIFNLKLETVMFYMPIFVSSLLVIPLILIGWLYKKTLWGFFASLISGIAHSFYNRSSPGYFDTDMFSILIPALILFFFLYSIKKKSIKGSLAAGFCVFIYPFFYSTGTPISHSLVIAFFGYQLLFHRKEEHTWKTIIIVSSCAIPFNFIPEFAIMTIPLQWIIQLSVIILIFLGIKYIKIDKKVLIITGIIVLLLYILSFSLTGPLRFLLNKVFRYTTRSLNDTQDKIKFAPSTNVIREAQKTPLTVIAERIIGAWPAIFLSIIGYIILVIKKKEFLIALPFCGLGFFSIYGGLRFTIHAIPIAALSTVYLSLFLCALVYEWLKIKQKRKYFIYIGAGFITVLLLIPNIKHIVNDNNPVKIRKDTIQALDNLKKKARPGDYVITSWGHGSRTWFYSGLNTFAAPSSINRDNFIISQVFLSSSQRQAVNLTRLAVEKIQEVKHKNPPEAATGYSTAIEYIFKTKTEHPENPDNILSELASESYIPPKKTKDAYFFMTFDMLRAFRSIAYFSNINLLTGKRKNPLYFRLFPTIIEKDDYIFIGGGYRIDKRRGTLLDNKNRIIKIKTYTTSGYTKDKQTVIQTKTIDEKAKYHLVYCHYLPAFLLMDERTYNSNFIQMFLLDNFDRSLFKPVHSDPRVKIFKLK